MQGNFKSTQQNCQNLKLIHPSSLRHVQGNSKSNPNVIQRPPKLKSVHFDPNIIQRRPNIKAVHFVEENYTPKAVQNRKPIHRTLKAIQGNVDLTHENYTRKQQNFAINRRYSGTPSRYRRGIRVKIS